MHEMNCLEHICLKLTAAKMSGRECKALFVELVLACNGTQLSDDFLIKLARLMKHHGIGIVVNEVLTCGRCGTFLLTTKKTNEFQNQVSHITIGKWVGCGMTFCNTNFAQKDETDLLARGHSTTHPESGAFNALKQCKALADCVDVEGIRSKTIKAMRCKEDECWGSGCLVFGTVVKRSKEGIGNRCLPKFSNQMKIQSMTKNCQTVIEKSKHNKN